MSNYEGPVTPRSEMDVEGLPPDFEEVPAPEPTSPAGGNSGGATPAPGEHGQFARRVASVFSTQVAMFAIAFTTAIVVSRVLGREGKGAYVGIVTFPAFLSAFAMMGLPSAVNYFAGRGTSLTQLTRLAYVLTAALAAITLTIVWFALPAFEPSILSAPCTYQRAALVAAHLPVPACTNDDLIRLILVTVPFSFLSAFGGAILYGRQAVKRYNLIQVAMAVSMLVWVLITVWFLRLGIRAAVLGSVGISVTTAVLVMATVHRLPRPATAEPIGLRRLAGYSARTYPASLAGYFSLRADTFILQAVMADPARHANPADQLGLYSMAVTMDELLFYVPNAVATLFLPRVAGMDARESNAMVGRVGRLTTLITFVAGLALIPVAFVGIHLVLPVFADCLPAFLVLLPGVLSMSVGKVMTSFIAGRGHPGTIAVGSMISVLLNVALNIVFIPAFGIVGASMASLASYSLQAAIAVWFASRLSGQQPLSLFVPGRAEVALLITTLPRLLHSAPVLNRLPFARSRNRPA